MTKTQNKPNMLKRSYAQLQKIGKALLFPIAMLPFAAIFLRIGATVPGTTHFSDIISHILMGIGNAVFDNLALLFAIGVAFGLAKDNRGEAAISGFVTFLLFQQIVGGGNTDFVNVIYGNTSVDFHELFGDKYDQILVNNVLAGIVAGSVVSFVYNRFNGIELPSILGFFSGRRLIPVMSAIVGLAVMLGWSLLFPWVGYVLQKFSEALVEAKGNRYANAGIMGIYGTINRLLIPFGLHHVPNTLFWFSSLGGSQATATGGVAEGDINAFLSGIPQGNTAGTFQSGFFPVMMFGLPALAYGIYSKAENADQKRKVASLFIGSAIVSFFTGITEPIEFTFIFMAPALFTMHAIFTGIVGFITGLFGIQLGFGFSAGLIDYALSIPKSLDIISANKSGMDAVMANPVWIWVIGAGTAAAYFFGTRFLISKYNLNTPGRGTNLLTDDTSSEDDKKVTAGGTTARAKKYVKALGGYANITMYSHCATRLRYDVKDMSKVDEKALQTAGAFGVNKVTKTHLQVVVGPTVEILNNEILAGKPATSKAKVKGEVPA